MLPYLVPIRYSCDADEIADSEGPANFSGIRRHITPRVNMTEFQYKRAPIIEASVEFRSATSVDGRQRKKALKHLSKFYAEHTPINQQKVELEFRPEGAPKTKTTDSVLDKFSSGDMTQQLHITDTSFALSQLAPYSGWGDFKARVKRDWEAWRSSVSFQPIERVGMRYINRIDVPIEGKLVHYGDYVTVYPALPPILNSCISHSVNVRVLLGDIGSVLNLRSAAVDSPLPEHVAIVVDLDIVRVYETPPSNEELYSYLNQARIKKNEIFEACITNNAREIFGR